MLKKDQGDTKKFGYHNYSTIHQNKKLERSDFYEI